MDSFKSILVLSFFLLILYISIGNILKLRDTRNDYIENCISNCTNNDCKFLCEEETDYNNSVRIWVFLTIISLSVISCVLSSETNYCMNTYFINENSDTREEFDSAFELSEHEHEHEHENESVSTHSSSSGKDSDDSFDYKIIRV